MRLTENELMMLRAKQKGRRAIREGLIDVMQHLEPMSIKDKRRLRFEQKQKYFIKKGVSGY